MLPSDPILASFAALAKRRPDAPLVVSDRRRASVGDIDSLARRMERTLAEARLPPGALVGFDAPNGPGFLAGIIALRRASCAALLLESSAPVSERTSVALEMGAWGVLHSDAAWSRSRSEFRFEPSGPRPRGARTTDPDVAVVKLTSGSTGRPEGILTPSECLVADDAALASTMGLRAEDRILAGVPFSHSYGLSSIVMPALIRGSTIVLPASRGPLASVLAAARHGVTFLPTVPAYLAALVRLSSPPQLGSTLRTIVAAGAPLTPETAARFRATFGRPVHVFYGASECGGITYDREGTAAERGSVGGAVDGVHVELERSGDRATSVVTVRSPAVARSYVSRTRDRLGNGRFRSSDLGRWEGGELVLVGRLDELINVRGKKVNPREVESVLRQMAEIDEVVVVGVAERHGGSQMIRAIVVSNSARPDEGRVRAWCQENLAGHKVPRSFVFVGALPRNERGKLDREALGSLGDAPSMAPRAANE